MESMHIKPLILASIFIAIVLSLGIPQVSLAVPAAPVEVTLEQPGSDNFQAQQWGDESSHGWETSEGYTIVKEHGNNRWKYAMLDNEGNLVPSRVQVGRGNPPAFAKGLRPKHHIVKKEMQREKAIYQSRAKSMLQLDGPQMAPPKIGTNNIPVFLIKYSGGTSTYTTTNFNDLLFGTGNSSMKDFYGQASYGVFSVSAGPGGVQGWFTAANNHDYYGTNDAGGNDSWPGTLVREAAIAADAAGFNFAPYDQDGDCKVDALAIVHEGEGEEAGGAGTATDIWSHRWNLFSANFYGRSNGGPYTTNDPCPAGGNIVVDDYIIQPEKSYGQMQTIGVFAHEYGHALGLPDLYDTDYTSSGIGKWSLMAGGSWNYATRSGDSPAHPDAWCKYFLGWVTPTNVSGTLTSESITSAHQASDVYRLLTGTATTGEYFLVENRQKSGFDVGLPASGLLIWHIDTAKSNNNSECYIGDCSTNHFKVALEQSDGQYHLEKKTNSGDTGDPYPGFSSNTSFTNATTPNSLLYSGTAAGVSISTIGASGNPMTATLSTEGVASYQLQVTKNGCATGVVTASYGTLSWSGNVGTASYSNGTGVMLTATPDSGMVFAGWGGDCIANGTNPSCPLTMNSNKNVVAYFWQPGMNWCADGLWHEVTDASTPASRGFSSTSPNTWWYGQNGTGNYDTGNASNKGALTSPPMSILTGANVDLWSWEKTENSAGYDTRKLYISTDAGQTWTQLHDFFGNENLWYYVNKDLTAYAGTQVILKLEFDTIDETFNAYQGWYVDELKVNFPAQTLTVSKNGSGTGAVTSAPAGIDCGATCAADFGYGTVVTLTASPDAGTMFMGWSGAGCPGTGTCVVNMNAAQNVTATFNLIPTQTLTVSKDGTGTGTVTSSPAGIDCGATCAADFVTNANVTLTATPDAGSLFIGWSDVGCPGKGTCLMTMDAAKGVTATFELNIAPAIQSLSPSYLSSAPDVAQDFTAVYSDANGYADIKWAYIRVQTNANGIQAYYDRTVDKLYLTADSGSGTVGNCTPGTTGTLANTQGSIDCALTTVTNSGNNMTITWNIKPTAAYQSTSAKNMYLKAVDMSGLMTPTVGSFANWVDSGDWLIYPPTAPAVVSITPSVLVSAPSVMQTFTAVYRDYNGYNDLKQVYLRIYSNVNGIQVYYDRPSNKIYLTSDAGSGPAAGYCTPGEAKSISNSQGIVDCALTTVSGTLNTLTVNWTITPKPAFESALVRNIFLLAKDMSNTSTAWTDKGDWTIFVNQPPTLGSVTPPMISSAVGYPMSFAAVYSDPNGYVDIKYAYFRVHSNIGGIQAYYYKKFGKLTLLNDAGTSAGTCLPGQAVILQNSQGILNCEATSVTGVGNDLTIKWSITPKAAFQSATPRSLYAKITDNTGLYAGFTAKGSWLIKPAPTPDANESYVPGGCFLMGDTFGDGLADELPVHTVCIDSIYMDKFEVTQGEYFTIMGTSPSSFSACGSTCPVETVTWQNAADYCAALGKELPTEAEWEYAARGGAVGSKWAGTSTVGVLGDYAWYDANASSAPHAVGQKLVNDFGLFDMSGNVMEWVAGWYDENYYSVSPLYNPTGPATGTYIMARGGSWFDTDWSLRAPNRAWLGLTDTSGTLGFRCMRLP